MGGDAPATKRVLDEPIHSTSNYQPGEQAEGAPRGCGYWFIFSRVTLLGSDIKTCLTSLTHQSCSCLQGCYVGILTNFLDRLRGIHMLNQGKPVCLWHFRRTCQRVLLKQHVTLREALDSYPRPRINYTTTFNAKHPTNSKNKHKATNMEYGDKQ